MKLKDKTLLKETLSTENYDRIVFFNNGEWNKISTGTDVSNDKDVLAILSRVNFYDVTKKQIKDKLDEIEFQLNYEVEY
jgi:hypothetical protein